MYLHDTHVCCQREKEGGREGGGRRVRGRETCTESTYAADVIKTGGGEGDGEIEEGRTARSPCMLPT